MTKHVASAQNYEEINLFLKNLFDIISKVSIFPHFDTEETSGSRTPLQKKPCQIDISHGTNRYVRLPLLQNHKFIS